MRDPPAHVPLEVQQGTMEAEMATNGAKQRKMGRVARRVARVERRTIRLLMIPVILVAQRRMMRSLEHSL
jgi:hypothetical protein